MTIEVAVINAFGAAMAADSAISFQEESGTGRGFSHCDKIFDLSHEGLPAGVMVFGSLLFFQRSWGAIFGSFRSKGAYLDDMVSLATELVQYLTRLASGPDIKIQSKDQFIGARVLGCIEWLDDDSNADTPIWAGTRPRSSRKYREEYLRPGGDGDLLARVITDRRIETRDVALSEEEAALWPGVISDSSGTDVAELGHAARKYLGSTLETGLVLVGYDRDAFEPCLIEVFIYRDGSRMWVERREVQRLDAAPAILRSFSVDDEILAFGNGIHPELSDSIPTILGDLLDRFCSDHSHLVDESDELRVWAARAAEEAVRKWEDRRAKFAADALAGLARLPPRMLTWVSKVLIEKAILGYSIRASEMERVGAPINIAMISRETGFVFMDKAIPWSEVLQPLIPLPR